MSWAGYVDSVIDNSSGTVSKGAIIGLDGSIWTPAGDAKILNVDAAAAAKMAGAMKAKSNEAVLAAFGASGWTVGGQKYQFLRDLDADGRTIMFKAKGVGQICAASSTQGIVIAFSLEEFNNQHGEMTKAVSAIVKYLEGVGY